MLSPHATEDIAQLADGCANLHGVDEERKHVDVALCRLFDREKRLLLRIGIAAGAPRSTRSASS